MEYGVEKTGGGLCRGWSEHRRNNKRKELEVCALTGYINFILGSENRWSFRTFPAVLRRPKLGISSRLISSRRSRASHSGQTSGDGGARAGNAVAKFPSRGVQCYI